MQATLLLIVDHKIFFGPFLIILDKKKHRPLCRLSLASTMFCVRALRARKIFLVHFVSFVNEKEKICVICVICGPKRIFRLIRIIIVYSNVKLCKFSSLIFAYSIYFLYLCTRFECKRTSLLPTSSSWRTTGRPMPALPENEQHTASICQPRWNIEFFSSLSTHGSG